MLYVIPMPLYFTWLLTVPELQGIPAEASDLPPQEPVGHTTAQQPRQPPTASNSKSLYIYLC